MTPRVGERTAYLYFAYSGIWRDDLVKIGMTEKLQRRMAALHAVPLVAVTDEYVAICALERAIHDHYSVVRCEIGEWFYWEFDLADDLKKMIDDLEYWPWTTGKRVPV